jgi:uncharacterized FlaG/YvyC family protein
MIAINNVSGVTSAGVLPTSTPAQANHSMPKQNKVSQTLVESSSAEVELSSESKLTQITGQTSVQFGVDQDSGKSVVTVISKDDNHVIRKIPSPIPSPAGKHPDGNPVSHPTINITV